MGEMKEFEWDEVKRQSNIEKHKIDFVLASKVFMDPKRIEWSIANGEEVRTITIGIVKENIVVVICVVWTKRGTKKRIISARRASQNERKKYEG
jgi:uncharacterized DUF497 family protein